MKSFPVILIIVSLLAACGGGLNGKKMAEKICDCNKKIMAMDVADPKRTDAQMDCSSKDIDALTQLKDNKEQTDAFNKRLNECAAEQYK